MSAFGGKADVLASPFVCPLIATTGHWAFRYLSFDRFRAVLDGTDRARYRADTVISCAMSLPKVQVL